MAGPFVVATADTLQVNVYTGQQAQLGINRLHYQVFDTNQRSIDSTVVALAWFNYISPFYKQLLTNSASVINLGIKRLLPAPVTVEDFAMPPAAGGGTGGTAPIPGQVSGLLTKRTPMAGRAHRGRVYVPFPDESQNDPVSNFPLPSYVNLLDTLGSQLGPQPRFVIDGTQCIFQMMLLHRKTNTFDQITSVIPRPRWATQRRRGNYGRPNVAPG